MQSKFTWTKEFKKTWDVEEEKNVKNVTKISKETNLYRKNIVREVLIIVDVSESIEKTDYYPTIRTNIVEILENFDQTFTKLNPLASLSYLAVNNKIQQFTKTFTRKTLNFFGSGYFDILKCLKTAVAKLNKDMIAKEFILITGSTNTHSDGESTDEVLDLLQSIKVKVNILSLCGEVTFFKKISNLTQGTFIVPFDKNELSNLIYSFIQPSETFNYKTTLIKVGFPAYAYNPGVCACHLTFQQDLLQCPQCNANVCVLPTICPLCSLNLISPIDLGVSMSYNFPLNSIKKSETGKSCKICKIASHYECDKCKNCFCEECNVKIQNVIKFCPFCV